MRAEVRISVSCGVIRNPLKLKANKLPLSYLGLAFASTLWGAGSRHITALPNQNLHTLMNTREHSLSGALLTLSNVLENWPIFPWNFDLIQIFLEKKTNFNDRLPVNKLNAMCLINF